MAEILKLKAGARIFSKQLSMKVIRRVKIT